MIRTFVGVTNLFFDEETFHQSYVFRFEICSYFKRLITERAGCRMELEIKESGIARRITADIHQDF